MPAMPPSKVDFRRRPGVWRRPLVWRSVLFCLLCLWSWRSPALAESGFFDLVEDLPLMPGLAEVADAGVVFDKPGGRIVEAYAVGAVAEDSVLAFYQTVLPELGWRPLNAAGYLREGEHLRLRLSREAETVTLRITITPD
jgi:hypothetical protein